MGLKIVFDIALGKFCAIRMTSPGPMKKEICQYVRELPVTYQYQCRYYLLRLQSVLVYDAEDVDCIEQNDHLQVAKKGLHLKNSMLYWRYSDYPICLQCLLLCLEAYQIRQAF
jgi:hypothetical protein